MLCCALGLLALITGASARGLRSLLGAWPAVMAVTASAAGLAYLVPHHLDHYRERARDHDRTLLAEIVAAPICKGRSHG